MKATSQLRQMLESPGMIVAPFAFDALQAKMVESVGFPAVYMTGFGTAAARGYPDVGLITMSEMIQNAKYMAAAVEIPLICDSDTGYGNPINVWRTVQEYEAVGAAAIHIEDQVWPKKCGFLERKQVIPLEEMVQKVRAALDARKDKDFVIIARTDALAVNGWEDTIRRCRAYREAGADLVFVDGVGRREDLETYAEALRDIPKVYNGWFFPTHEVEKLGFKLMLIPTILGAIFKGVRDALEELKATGFHESLTSVNFADVVRFLGVPRIYEMERRYAVEETTGSGNPSSRE